MFFIKIDERMVGITPSNVCTFGLHTGKKLKVDLAQTLQRSPFEAYRYFVETTGEDGSVLCIPLTRTNVYAFCGVCGKTFQLDLCEYAGNPQFDPFRNLDLCKTCEAMRKTL